MLTRLSPISPSILAVCSLLALVAAGCNASGPTSAPPVAASPSAAAVVQPTSLPAPTEAAAPAERYTVSYGKQGGDSAYYWPLYVAQDQGFFAQQGIDLDIVAVNTTPDAIRALASGSLHIVDTTPNPALIAVDQGAPLGIIAGGLDKLTTTLVGAPAIKQLSDLRGKKVVTATLSDASAQLLRTLLKRAGLQDEQDYDLLATGGGNDRLVALTTGAVDAALLAPPNALQLADQGYNILGSLADVEPQYMFLALVANTQWAEANSRVATGFVRAWSAACRWLYAPANRDAAVALLANVTKTEPTLVRVLYERQIERDKVFPPDGSANPDSLQAVIDLMEQTGDLKPPLPSPSKYLVPTYFERARSESESGIGSSGRLPETIRGA